MKNSILKITFGMAIFVALFGLSAQKAEAASPVLTLTNAGNSQVRIEVTGDVNSNVQLYYYNTQNSGSIVNEGVIGSTDSSGYFSTVVSQNSYGIFSGANVFVNVNNQQSTSVTWPTITGGNIMLSSTSLYLNVNQSNTVSVSGGTGTYYISSNSNSSIVTASINGSVITVAGINGGSSTLTICSASSGSSCATLYVSVGGNNNNNGSNNITFSQSNINVQTGQTQSVNIYGNGNYYVSGNSGSGIASVTINGSSVNVYGIGNGSATFAICSQSSGTSCANLYVTVSSSYNNGYNNYNNNYPNNYYPYNNYTYPNNNTYYQQPVVYTQPTVTYVQPTVQSAYGQPVAGVYLSQIPATGIKLDLKIVLFLLGLLLWSSAMAYFIINKRTKNTLAHVSYGMGSAKTSLTKAEAFKLRQLNNLR